MEHTNRQELGELAANFLDMLDGVQHPIRLAGFVAVASDPETGKRSIITRTTSENSSANLEMFHDAATVEHIAFVAAAESLLNEAGGEE